jgi:N-glycosylase/DNA lyase
MNATVWSDWQPLPGISNLTPAVLAEILDGGQSFRWLRQGEPSAPRPVRHSSQSDGGNLGETGPSIIWQGIWSDYMARLRLTETRTPGPLEWSAPVSLQARVATALPAYLTGGRDFSDLADALPWRSDAHLARCLAAFPGLTIPRQPFGETLLCFLCSATKQIVQIKQMVALLAARHGRILGERVAPNTIAGRAGENPVHLLPDWSELAKIPESDLRACLLGFRARYIKATALHLAARPGWVEETEHLPYAAAKARLLELPGVGEKVADCVLLFGAGKLEAFPVDTWILKAMTHHYGLDGWSPAQVAHFGRMHFGPLAGLAQQYLFAWERRHRDD